MRPIRFSRPLLTSLAGALAAAVLAGTASAQDDASYPTKPIRIVGGKIGLIAMTGPSRLPELPKAPTAAEAGFGNIDARLQWIGAFAIAGTPPAIVQKLEVAIRRALADSAVRDKLKALAYAPDGRSGEEFRQLIDADIKAYADVVRAANLKFD
jgi:tripartite-type tricarboxylate transporter receptor subunit TctC